MLYSLPHAFSGVECTQPAGYCRSTGSASAVFDSFFCTAYSRSPGMSACEIRPPTLPPASKLSATENSMLDCPL